MSLGTRLKFLRQRRGYTHQELAEMLGLGIRQIARYESEENEPTADILARMARVFEVSTDYLLGLTDNPNPHLQTEDLTPKETAVISAWRRGDKLEAIKTIINDEKAPSGA